MKTPAIFGYFHSKSYWVTVASALFTRHVCATFSGSFTVWSAFLMKYIAAYLLAQIGGDATPGKDKIKAILESVGIAVDEAAIDELLKKFEGKNVDELIAEGSSKLSLVSGGGGGGAAAAAGGAAAPAAKEEEKKEEEEALEMAGGFDDLFG